MTIISVCVCLCLPVSLPSLHVVSVLPDKNAELTWVSDLPVIVTLCPEGCRSTCRFQFNRAVAAPERPVTSRKRLILTLLVIYASSKKLKSELIVIFTFYIPTQFKFHVWLMPELLTMTLSITLVQEKLTTTYPFIEILGLTQLFVLETSSIRSIKHKWNLSTAHVKIFNYSVGEVSSVLP